MGYIKHNAIIATTWQTEAADGLVDYAKRVGAEAIRGEERTNGYVTVCITPDGSKEGWESSNEGDGQRGLLRQWLEGADMQGFYFEWCEVGYGNDDGGATVVASAWGNAPTTAQEGRE